jgi:hypothetical protein
MEAAEVQSIFFGPLAYAFYLLAVFVGMVVYYEIKWSNTCDKNIQILVVLKGGGGDFQLAPKTGGNVTLKNPEDGTTRTWPINELTTIDVRYPGVGFVPAALQKTIRMAILHEGDWEPLLNRSPHMKKIASPDVVSALRAIAGKCNATVEKQILTILDDVRTSPTREMIADPATLGNLMQSSILQALATVSKDVVDSLKGVASKLNGMVNAKIVYIGLGLAVIMMAFLLIQVMPLAEKVDVLAGNVDAIQRALGVLG